MSQTETVLQQLRGGPITSLEMIQRFGITRLATHIYTLRMDGFDIETKLVRVRNRFGEDCNFASYTLRRRRRKPSPRMARVSPRKRRAGGAPRAKRSVDFLDRRASRDRT